MVHNQHEIHEMHFAAFSHTKQRPVKCSVKAAHHTPHESHMRTDKSSMLCAAFHLQETVNGLMYRSRATLTGTGEELFFQQCLLPYPPGFVQASVMQTQLLSLFDVMHSIHVLHSPCNTMLHGSCKAVQQDHSESRNNVCWCVAFHKKAGRSSDSRTWNQASCHQSILACVLPRVYAIYERSRTCQAEQVALAVPSHAQCGTPSS